MGRKKQEVEREDRDELEGLSDNELLKPFDATKFGSDEDPCYGKLFDYNAPECQMCGDSEHCQIAMTQGGHLRRALEGGPETFLDQEEDQPKVDTKQVKRFYRMKKKEGLTRIKAIAATAKEFNITKAEVKLLIPAKKKSNV